MATTLAEKLIDHTTDVVKAAHAATETAAQVADTYLQGGASGWRNFIDAELFDAAMTLRAAADRLDALRREHHTARMMATSLTYSLSQPR